MTPDKHPLIWTSFVLFLAAFVGIFISAHSNSEGFEDGSSYIVQGNVFYREGEFVQAADLYEKALAAGIDNAHVHYNLGNAFYRLKEYGKAILHYRRALRQRPKDPDILANLRLARRQAEDKLPFEDSLAKGLASRLLSMPSQLSRFQRSLLFIFSYVVFWLCFALIPLIMGRGIRIVQLAALISTLLFSVALFATRDSRDGTLVFAFDKEEKEIAPAVIVSAEAKVFSGDSTQFQVIFVLHDGAEVEVGRVRDSWVEIILPARRQGWVRKENVEII